MISPLLRSFIRRNCERVDAFTRMLILYESKAMFVFSTFSKFYISLIHKCLRDQSINILGFFAMNLIAVTNTLH